MTTEHRNRLLENATRILFFTGKGGVGKTSLACAAAVSMAQRGQKVLLVSTDPASNLDEVLGVRLSGAPTAIPGADGLFALNIDPEAAAKAYRDRVIGPYRGVLPEASLNSMEEQLSGACTVEIAAFDEFTKLLGDECHHHATIATASALPSSAAYRLGLSATPEHGYNTTADQRLQEYYGNIIARYTLADALKEGVLTPYEYYVHPVPLDHDEAEEYFELSKRISVLLAQGTDVEDAENSYLEALLIARARLLGSAQQKLTVLDTVLRKTTPHPLTLFYCGDGRVTDDVSGEEIRQIDAVSQRLFDRGWKTSQFTARENLNARRAILDNFRIGDIDALVAIRCLDEGIDIPGCATAFLLASARNARQFIQRRGRILRKAPGKSRAYIHDFLVYNPFPVTPETLEAERRLMDAELARVNEFANTALNPYDAERVIATLPRH